MNNPPVSSSVNSIHAERPISSPPLPIARRKLDLPFFSSLPLLFLVMVKPLTDAFYEVEAVKYGYILLLGLASLFARYGMTFQGAATDPRNKSLLAYIWLIALYFVFLFGLAIVYGGSLSEIFKIVSPFVFFVLVAYAADRWMFYALVGGAVLTICVNAALLPFDFGWVQWGSVRTFKGYYFFKTDLAYALCFATLIYALYSHNRITPVLALLMAMAAVQIILSNSRLNYFTFLIALIFIAFKGGISFRMIIRFGLLFGGLALIVMLVYDPTNLLGFDTSNERAFTQGRSDIWTNLIVGITNFSPLEWLFGRGLSGDIVLAAENSLRAKDVHNAHNEMLHLLATEGIFGSIFYTVLWIKMFRMSHNPNIPKWARGTGMVALLLFILQGLTTVMSPLATKTWPLVMVLLALRGLSSATDQHKQLGSPS
ncbi:MAG: O-antigen ligase family protein [Burkholderiales bacterium]